MQCKLTICEFRSRHLNANDDDARQHWGLFYVVALHVVGLIAHARHSDNIGIVT